MALVLFLPGIFVEHSCSGLLDGNQGGQQQPKEQQLSKAEADGQSPQQQQPPHQRRKLFMQFSSISVVDGQLLQKYSRQSNSEKTERPNMLATFASTYNFFCFLFNFVLLET